MNLASAFRKLRDGLTERSYIEEDLRRSEEKYRSLVEDAPIGIISVDRSGRITEVNRRLLEIIGSPSADATKAINLLTFPALVQAGVSAKVKTTMEEACPIHAQIPYTSQWGKESYLRILLRPIFGTAGKVVGCHAVVEDISEEHRAKAALNFQLELQQLITRISTRFVSLGPEEIDGGIREALKEIGHFVGVDRSYVFLFSQDGKRMDNTHEWCAHGIDPQIANLKGICVEEKLPWCTAKMKRSEVVHVPSIDDLPPEAIAEKEFFLVRSIRSLIMLPMAYRESLLGFLGFDLVREQRMWSEEPIALFQVVGQIFVNALIRKRTEEALRESEERHRLVWDTNPDAFSISRLDTGALVDVNRGFLKTHRVRERRGNREVDFGFSLLG